MKTPPPLKERVINLRTTKTLKKKKKRKKTQKLVVNI
jgi:hypothetical protein